MRDDSLFALPSDVFKVTSDDCYTPRWVFDAMGLEFDLDVAAPNGGPWHVPAKLRHTKWLRTVMDAAEAVSLNTVEFVTPDGGTLRPRACIFVAFRGVGTEPAERLAAADPNGAVLYGRTAA